VGDTLCLLPAGSLAQLEAVVDDPDNRCCVCEEFISGPTAEVAVFTDEKSVLVRLAHGECMSSGIHPLPGLQQGMKERVTGGEPFAMATMLGLRRSEPRALIFLEPEMLVARPEEDGLELWALRLGLAPVSGTIEDLAAPTTSVFWIERIAGGLALRSQGATDTVPASDAEVHQWVQHADGRALVIVARGLGLNRPDPPIAEALATRPTWAGVSRIADAEAAEGSSS
jgi:hypothetical protein